MFVPRVPVPPPALTPRRFGLFSVAAFPAETEERWRGDGIVLDPPPDGCGLVTEWEYGCPPDSPDPKVVSGDGGTMGGNPFTVYAGAGCSPAGISAAEFDRRAQARLLAGEERGVEEHLAGIFADAGASPVDMDGWTLPAEVDRSSTATGAATALGLVEQELAVCYGGRGVVHTGVLGLTLLAAQGLVVRNGQVMETTIGNLVAVHGHEVFGDGTGEVRLWATGAVSILRSGVEMVGDFASSLDRTVNTVARIAERTYVVTWDCCLATATFPIGTAL